ncbi:hypothetical protein [Emticicia agri]|uniref:Uncharacterized protein n=1 Tax=Emticicia agri TaxID=2492393 RepID=A0A4V1ZCL3_9BACT|nr:hypothetical protein [Emticicia agri]RYU93060.1 hypothetical protein EWM59_24025 [Emticicia agri]
MNNPNTYDFPEEFAENDELMQILENGTIKEKEHALLNIALGGHNSEDVLDLFLYYTADPELEAIAFMCIDKFLENYRHYPLTKILWLLIDGLTNAQESIRYHCQGGLDNLVSPTKLKEETLSFESFQIDFKYDNLAPYLASDSAEEIIIALLYLFYHPHKDEELFKIVDEQLAKNITAVNCIAGAIIDAKLSDILEMINAVGELSLVSYNHAKASGLKSKASWVYDRFDSMRELAREHMKVMLAERQEVK